MKRINLREQVTEYKGKLEALATIAAEVDGLKAKLATVEGEKTNLAEAKSALESEVATANAAKETLEGEVTSLKAKVAELEANQATSEEKAREILGSLGVIASEDGIKIDPEMDEESPDFYRAAYMKIEDAKERSIFYARHKDKIFAP